MIILSLRFISPTLAVFADWRSVYRNERHGEQVLPPSTVATPPLSRSKQTA